MKSCRLFIIISFVFIGLFSCQQKKPTGNRPPHAVYDSMDKNLGELIISDKPVTVEFQVTNDGDRSLHIFDVARTCDCTEIEFSDEQLFNGDKTTIKVSLDIHDFSEGPFERMIGVRTNAKQRSDTLYFHGVAKRK